MAGSGIASYKGGSLTLPRTSNFLFYVTTAVYRVTDPGRFQPGSDTRRKNCIKISPLTFYISI